MYCSPIVNKHIVLTILSLFLFFPSISGQNFAENNPKSLYEVFNLTPQFKQLPNEIQALLAVKIMNQYRQAFFPIRDSLTQKISNDKELEVEVLDGSIDSTDASLNKYKKLDLITGMTLIDEDQLLVSGKLGHDGISKSYKLSVSDLVNAKNGLIRAYPIDLTGDLVNSPIQVKPTKFILNNKGKYTEVYEQKNNSLVKKLNNRSKILGSGYNSMRYNSNEDCLAVSARDGKAILYFGKNFDNSIILEDQDERNPSVCDSEISPSGKYVVTTGDRKVCLWELPSGRLVKTFLPKTFSDQFIGADVQYAKFVSDDFLLAPEGSETFALYSLPDFKIIKEFKGQNAPIDHIGLDVKKDLVFSFAENRHEENESENYSLVIWQLSTASPLVKMSIPQHTSWLQQQIFLRNFAFIQTKGDSRYCKNNKIYSSNISSEAINYLNLLKNGLLTIDQVLLKVFLDLFCQSSSSNKEQLFKLPFELLSNIILVYNSLDETIKTFFKLKHIILVNQINNLMLQNLNQIVSQH